MDISRPVFIPEPNVDSSVLGFEAKGEKEFIKNPQLFYQLIRDAFTQKRKNLRNNLKKYDFDLQFGGSDLLCYKFFLPLFGMKYQYYTSIIIERISFSSN